MIKECGYTALVMEIIPVYFRGGSLPLRPGQGTGLPPLRGFHPRNAPELLPDNSRGVFPADIFMPKAVYTGIKAKTGV
jgi:hypothetical protein